MDLFGQSSNNFDDYFQTLPQAPNLNKQVKQKISKSNKSKKKNAKIDYAKKMETAHPSPFFCKNHEQMRLKFRDPPKNPGNCGSCGFKLEGKSGYISCSKQQSCFSLCSVCKVCSKNHFLRKVSSLVQFEDENSDYAANKFACKSCSIEQTLGQNGVWFCPPCNFAICTKCIDKYNQQWERLLEGKVHYGVIKESQQVGKGLFD